jgi:hypothetical protein
MHFDTLGAHWQDWLIYTGLATLALSFAVAHLVAGRILACVAFAMFAVYSVAGDAPQWLSLLIVLGFLALNGIHLALLRRRPASVHLTAQERALKGWLFPSMADGDFRDLLRVSERNIASAGTFLATQGEHLEKLHVIIQGNAHVVFNGMVVATLRDGSLVGEVSFFRDDVATASVVAQTDLSLLSLSRKELRQLMKEHGSVKQALHESIGRDLGFKLTAFDQEHSRF